MHSDIKILQDFIKSHRDVEGDYTGRVASEALNRLAGEVEKLETNRVLLGESIGIVSKAHEDLLEMQAERDEALEARDAAIAERERVGLCLLQTEIYVEDKKEDLRDLNALLKSSDERIKSLESQNAKAVAERDAAIAAKEQSKAAYLADIKQLRDRCDQAIRKESLLRRRYAADQGLAREQINTLAAERDAIAEKLTAERDAIARQANEYVDQMAARLVEAQNERDAEHKNFVAAQSNYLTLHKRVLSFFQGQHVGAVTIFSDPTKIHAPNVRFWFANGLVIALGLFDGRPREFAKIQCAASEFHPVAS